MASFTLRPRYAQIKYSNLTIRTLVRQSSVCSFGLSKSFYKSVSLTGDFNYGLASGGLSTEGVVQCREVFSPRFSLFLSFRQNNEFYFEFIKSSEPFCIPIYIYICVCVCVCGRARVSTVRQLHFISFDSNHNKIICLVFSLFAGPNLSIFVRFIPPVLPRVPSLDGVILCCKLYTSGEYLQCARAQLTSMRYISTTFKIHIIF